MSPTPGTDGDDWLIWGDYPARCSVRSPGYEDAVAEGLVERIGADHDRARQQVIEQRLRQSPPA